MVDLQVVTSIGTDTLLPEKAVEEFTASLRGQVVLPADDGYDEARTLHNAMIDKKPGMIVRCAGTADVQAMSDPAFQPGFQNYWKSNFMKELPDNAIDTIVDRFASVPSPHSVVLIENFGGAVARVSPEDTAFNHRDSQYNFSIFSVWDSPSDYKKNVSWTREFFDAMEPFFTEGVYVNYMSEDEGEDRVKAAFGGAEKYQRLAALKKKYDPTNLFRLNQNIKPTGYRQFGPTRAA